MIPVPNTSPTSVAGRFFVFQYTRPHSSAPHMLPGKASRLPRLRAFRSRLAANATTTPYHGPRNTAQITFTMCCTGAHWLPNTGNWNMLPTTATAHSTPARANFFVFIEIAPLIHQNLQGENGAQKQRFPLAAQGQRAKLARCGKSVEAPWPPLTPEHGFPSLFFRPGPRALPLGPLPGVPGRRCSCPPMHILSVSK